MKRYDGTMSDWRDEMGLTQRKTKEMWELDGYCEKCRKPTLAMSQSERRRLTNHPIKYWQDLYDGWMDNDIAVMSAFGYDNFIDSIAEGYLLDSPESPYAAARQYRQSVGLLMALSNRFGVDVKKHIEQLRTHPMFDPNDEWWTFRGF